MLIKCNCCGETFQPPNAGWWLCPTCRAQNYVPYPAEKNCNTAAVVIMCAGVGVGILFLALLTGIILIALCNTSEDTYSADSYRQEFSGSSLKSIIAKDYIDNLPAEQRNAILYGGGSSEDSANAIANLIESGNLEGAAEIVQGL